MFHLYSKVWHMYSKWISSYRDLFGSQDLLEHGKTQLISDDR